MNSKKRCKFCKSYFPAGDMVKVPAGTFCTIEHAMEFANQPKEREKADRKRNAEKKRQFNQSDVKTRQKAAKEACHAYIRERDKGKPCICCGKPLGDTYHAGHWIPSGQNPLIRYDEDNIHGQRVDCNYFKGGDSGDYEKNLIERIGLDRVQALKAKKGGTVKRTAEDYAEIERYYKQKLKELR